MRDDEADFPSRPREAERVGDEVIGGDDVVDLGKELLPYETLADFPRLPTIREARSVLLADLKPDRKLSGVKLPAGDPAARENRLRRAQLLDHHKEAVAHGMKREITEFPPIFLASGAR